MSLTNKDELWGFVKALKAQRTKVREHFEVEGSAEDRLVRQTQNKSDSIMGCAYTYVSATISATADYA